MGDRQRFGQPPYGDTEATTEDMVQTRALLHISASTGDVKEWMDNFFLNNAYGAFCMNILADVFVRLCFFVCTYLALIRCWKAKERENRLIDLQIQQCLDNYSDSQTRTFETYFRSESFIRRVSQAATPGAQSSLASAPSVLDSQVQANTSGEQLSSIPIVQGSKAGLSPACAPVMNSTNALPTVCEKVVESAADQKKGPFEQLPKRRNGYVHDCHFPDESRSSELTSSSSGGSSSSHSQKNVPSQARDDVVIDIPAICVFPTSASMEKGNKLKHFFKVRVGVSCDHDISSSRILQARVRATEENLSALRDVAVEGMKLDEGFTLQIGESILYYCDGNPEEPALLSLKDVEVPTVLQADYSVGVLTIRGRYLEGAEIRASTFDGYMILNFIKQDQIHSNIIPPERRLEVWRCTDLLPPVNLDRIHICASKAVPIEGHDVTVRSEVCSIQNTTLRTVIRTWVPTAILILFLISQAWILFALILNLVMDNLQPSRTWLSYPVLIALALYIIQELPQSSEDVMKAFVEQFKLAISSFQMVPDLLSSPPFCMRNGYCFQRGAKYLFDSKFIFGGRYHKGRIDRKGTPPFETSCDPRRSTEQEKESPHSSKSDENPENPEIPPTSRDWKWPCLREEYDKETKIYVTKRFDPNSKHESHDISDPFTVTYSELSKPRATDFGREVGLQYIPQNVSVKLYSKHLQAVVKALLPSKLKLFENYGEIQASDLLILYFSKLLEKGSKEILEVDREANDFLASNDKFEGECLDMFHLIRFLRKEYEETIIQYERMMEADVIAWDMLWTLIVPKADVVYYCTISKEEMCGKVLSTNYSIKQLNSYPTSDQPDEFIVDLEVYDYNCINFEAKKIKCVILPFKDEAKVSNIDVCPLQRKADSHRLEEFFLMRGRKFNDMVLKHERRFMQYRGVLYSSLSSQPRQVLAPKLASRSIQSWSIGYKENIDSRVMIDQVSFVKMNPNDDMATAEPSRGWFLGNESKMKTVIDEIDPQLLKYAPAVAYGYSFSVRKWGCFTIEGFTEIQFISTAFDTLVMNEDIKNTLLTLTEHHIKHPQGYGNGVARNVDPLPNKGKGCRILLHGAPGTGKTLTVESLAEKLECPLWQLSVSKFSKIVSELETDLLKSFEIAAIWRAILVLDEADVYLSSRKYSPLSSNVTRTNAMTGVFLRVLEYYTGILFLTTNVIHSIEPAIYSRMSLFVKYEEFNIEERKQLWINFLNRVGFQHPSQEFWDKVLPEKFNGRVIRNIIQNAQILAGSTGSSLSEDELLKACRVMATPYTTSQWTELEDNPDHPISIHASTSWKISDQQ
ncbi:hypothetical protein M758_2G236900 [Ceratodon purpureus]|nr:hypothetical protein M758_2G236900 [Ceratodon purpureus]